MTNFQSIRTLKNWATRGQRDLLDDQRGLSTVEYVIVLMLIAIVGIVAWQSFGASVSTKVTEANGQIGGLPTGGQQ